VTINERLDALTAVHSGQQVAGGAVHGWEPGIRYDPSGAATVTSGPLPFDHDPDGILDAMGVIIPDGYRARLVEVRHDPAAWTRAGQGLDAVTVPVVRCRWVVEPCRDGVALDDLLAVLDQRDGPKPAVVEQGRTLVVVVADTQLGDGSTALVVDRFADLTARMLEHATELLHERRIRDVLLAWVGDCIQGTVTAAPTAKNDLSLVEMLRVYRRLMLHQVTAFADLCPVRVAVVPGNHDQIAREGRSEAFPSDQSWAVEGAVQVADALEVAGRYGHVEFILPRAGHSTLAVDVDGTVVGLAHGHQWRGPAAGLHKWWAGQSHGRTAVGAADILVTGHRHHFYAEVGGANRLGLVAPALVDTDAYWRDGHGDESAPGMIGFIAGAGSWSDLVFV
jgi:hypothetical protein